jgi:hypothetical protein
MPNAQPEVSAPDVEAVRAPDLSEKTATVSDSTENDSAENGNSGATELSKTALPDVVDASVLISSGSLRASPRSVVRKRAYTSKVFRMASQDVDVTFDINREWEWFEVRVAVLDGSPRNTAKLRGWVNGAPYQTAFPDLKVRKGEAPVLLRVRVAEATQLTLSLPYPGNPIVLIEPRFIRRAP